MMHSTTIAVLPVGELDSGPIRNEFDAMLQTISRLAADVAIAEPVADQEAARQSVLRLSERSPDLLIIIPLRGLSAQTIEAAALASQAPCLICPVEGTFALPSSTLARGALREAKAPVELLYAPPAHPDVAERLATIIRAASAFSQIGRTRIGVIGGLFPNLVSCRYDPRVITSRLGVTLQPFSFEEIRGSIRTSAKQIQNVEAMEGEIAGSFHMEAADRNALRAGTQLQLALRQLALENKLDGFATECWSAFPKEVGLNPCMGFIEDAYTLACEGDVLLCISLLIVRYLTGRSAFVGDLYDLDQDGGLTLVHCGAPASLAAEGSEVLLGKSQLALELGFETLTCRPRLPAGPVTLFRLYGEACDRLHLAAGELLSSRQSPSLEVRFKLKGDRWHFLDQCFGNHYVAAAGDIRNELKLLGKWLGITVFET